MPRRLAAALAASVMPIGLFLAVGIPAQAASVTPDVVNGRPPASQEFGFLAQVRAYVSSSQYYICGGSFVSATQVVTAAHCVTPDEGETITSVEVGPAVGTSQPTSLVPASRVDVHKGYSDVTGANDIALITLESPVRGVPTVSIPTASQWRSLAAGGSPVESAGWGSTYSGGVLVRSFLVADLTVVPDSVCADGKATYPIGSLSYHGIGSDFDKSTMICAGGATSMGQPIDTCQGDSGGPLTADTGSGTYLVGIVSWGIGCAGMDDEEPVTLTPGVYTRLGSYLTWLATRGVSPRATAPGAPTDVTVQPISNTRINLTWTAPEADDGPPVEKYRVEYSKDGADFRLVGITEEAVTARQIANLTPGATYVFRAAAINSLGVQGDFSIPSQPYTMPGGKVTRPGVVSGFGLGSFAKKPSGYRVTVRWQAPEVTGGAEISGYLARWGQPGAWGAWSDLSRASVRLTGLSQATGYTVQVRAVNSVGWGPKASYAFTTPKR